MVPLTSALVLIKPAPRQMSAWYISQGGSIKLTLQEVHGSRVLYVSCLRSCHHILRRGAPYHLRNSKLTLTYLTRWNTSGEGKRAVSILLQRHRLSVHHLNLHSCDDPLSICMKHLLLMSDVLQPAALESIFLPSSFLCTTLR